MDDHLVLMIWTTPRKSKGCERGAEDGNEIQTARYFEGSRKYSLMIGSDDIVACECFPSLRSS